jgi:hypothetical protein
MVNQAHLRLLLDAKQRIEKGWCQGRMDKVDKKGNLCYCLVGAFLGFVKSTGLWHELRGHLEAQIKMDYPNFLFVEGYPQVSVVSWNDAPERTQEQVVALLGRTIERLENSNGS